jgi:hypothetical protein
MYFAFDSCTKGDKCPYLYDKNNLYKGAKPKALAKSTPAGSATVHAGAATILSGTVAASSVLGVKPQGPSSLSAPSMRPVPAIAEYPLRPCAGRFGRMFPALVEGASHVRRI